MDGKHFGPEGTVIASGVKVDRQKLPLGFGQTGTENERVGQEMIERLLERGLKIADGLLSVIDGSKRLRKAFCGF